MSKTNKQMLFIAFFALLTMQIITPLNRMGKASAIYSSEQDAVVTGDPSKSRAGISNYVIGPLGFYWTTIGSFCDALGVPADYYGYGQLIEKVFLPINLRFITIWAPEWGAGIAHAKTETQDIGFDESFDEFLSACDTYGVAVMFFWPSQWSDGNTQWSKDVYAQFPDLVTGYGNGTSIIPGSAYDNEGNALPSLTIDDPRYEMQLKEDIKRLYEYYGHHISWVGIGQFEGDFSHYAGYKGSGFKPAGLTPFTMQNYVYSKYFRDITDLETGLHKENGTECLLYETLRSSVPIKWGTWQNDPLYWDVYGDARDENNRNMRFLAIKFLATENLDGFKIVWYGSKVGSPPPLYVELYKNAGPYDGNEPEGYPCGIGSAPVEGPYQVDATSTENWQMPITFSSELAKSDFYWLVFYTTGGNSSSDKYQIWKRPYQVDESVIKWYYDSPKYNPAGFPPWHWGGSAVLKIQRLNGENVKIYPRQETTSVVPVSGVHEIPIRTSEPIYANTVFFHVTDRYWNEATTRIDLTRVSDGQVLATGYLGQRYLQGLAWWVPVELDQRVMLEPDIQYKIVITGPGTDEGAFQFHMLQTDPPELGFQGQEETFLFKLADMDLVVKHYSRSQFAVGLDTQRSLPGVTNMYVHAVRFKPTASSSLSSVAIDMMAKTGSPGDLKVALRADYDGTGARPTDTELDSVTIPAASIPTGRAILTASGWGGVSLQADNWYWIVFSAASGHPSNYYQISYSVSPYQFKWMASPDGGATWVTPRTDAFQKLSGGTTGYSIGELHVRVTTSAGEIFDGIDPFDRIASDVSLSADDFVAQSFKPSENMAAKGVLIAVENGRRRGEDDATVLVELQTDSEDQPSGTVLTKGKLTTLDDRVLDGIVPIDFELPVNLIAGTKYWLVFKGAGIYGGDRAPWIYLYPYMTASLSYGGTECGAKRSKDGGATWTKMTSFSGIPAEDVETIFAVYSTPGVASAYSISELSSDIEAYHAVPYFGLQGWNAYLNTRVDLIQKDLMEWLEGYSGGRMWMTIGPNIYDTIRDVGAEKYAYYGDFITGPLPPEPPTNRHIADDCGQKVANLFKQGNLGFMPGGSLGHSGDNTGAITKEQIGFYYRMAVVLLARAMSIFDMDVPHVMETGSDAGHTTHEDLQYSSKLYGAVLAKMRYNGGYYGHEKGAIKALFIGDEELGITPQFLSPAIDITLVGFEGINNPDYNLTIYGDFSQFDVVVQVSSRPSLGSFTPNAIDRIKTFVQNGGGLVSISGWPDWANEIMGGDVTDEPASGTKVINNPSHPILKPFTNLSEYNYYWKSRKIIPATCVNIVGDSNGMPWISENSYGLGRGVLVGIAHHPNLGKIGTYVDGGAEWYDRAFGAPNCGYWVLLSNAIAYAAHKEDMLPIWWYDTVYKAKYDWHKQLWYSICGKPGSPVLLWLSNNNETTNFQIHLNASFYSINHEGWMAIDVANWEVVAEGSGTDVFISTTVPSKSWRSIYIMNKTFSFQAMYSNIFVMEQHIDVATNTSLYILKGTYRQGSWLVLRSDKQPVSVQTNSSGMLQWRPLSILDGNATAEGWYYDAAHGIVLVKILLSSPYIEVTVAIESMEVQTLEASLTTNASAVVSTGNIHLSINVTSKGIPIQNAFVQLSSDLGGTFAPGSGYTTADGTLNAVFTAPNVTVQTAVRISASVSKLGFVTGAAYKDVSVFPPGASPTLLSITFHLEPQVISSGEGCLININVTDGIGNPIADVLITLTSNQSSSFFPSSGLTSSQGSFSSIFAAPNVTQQTSCLITINASKSGHLSAQNQTLVTVLPRLPNNGSFDYTFYYYLAIICALVITLAALIMMVLKRRKVPVVVQRF